MTTRITQITLSIVLAANTASAQLSTTITMDGYLVRLSDGAMLTMEGTVSSQEWPVIEGTTVEFKGMPTNIEPGELLVTAPERGGLQTIVFTGNSTLAGLVFSAGHEQFDAPGYRWHDRTDSTDMLRLTQLKCALGGKGDSELKTQAAEACQNLFEAPTTHIGIHTQRTKKGYYVVITGMENGTNTSETLEISDGLLETDPDKVVELVLDAVARADWSN